ncbi:MAG: AMP-binding protein [Bacteroidetes bacterium]|nr:AMP-binding protein [Bacteroidota bacterium]
MAEITSYYQPELTLPDLLKRAADRNPDLCTGYYDKNNILTFQTYKELLSEAKKIAGGLSAIGLNKGDKIIIATKSNRETIEILWGAFFLGVVPTILQPPAAFSEDNPAFMKLLNVSKVLDSPVIMMSPDVTETGTVLDNTIRHREDLDMTRKYPDPGLKPEDLAFIQFSSGSTGDPKGVMLTHFNLMINLDAMLYGFDTREGDRFGNWMPLFHDMGLIGYHLNPIYGLVSQYQLDTLDFVMNPALWLNMMSREKVTSAGTTNFGLALVLKYLKRGRQNEPWDFTHMKALLNGAEPISVRTMQEFIEALIPSKLKPEALMPVYGMAEATLAIAFASLKEHYVATAFNSSLLDRKRRAVPVDPSDPTARMLSEVGWPLNDFELRITDDHDNEVPEGNSGHIQIKGPSVTKGYYKNSEATASTFCGEWLRTGDMGFFFDGRLYISGRFKDIIFRNGIHYFANDLEDLACTIEEISIGKVIFGGTTDRETGEEKVIAFIAGLNEEKAREVFKKLRIKLRTTLGLYADVLVLVKSNEIPKTSSGKLQRYKLMQRYLDGEFDDKVIMPEKGDYP